MRCPRCHEPVVIIEHDEIELDHCLECRGIWFDGEELELLFDTAKVDIRAELQAVMSQPQLTDEEVEAVDEQWLDCPRCDDRMHKIRFGSDVEVNIDRCDSGDGLWFDRGELHQLMAHLNEVTNGALEKAVRFVEDVFPVDDEDAPEGPARAEVPEEERAAEADGETRTDAGEDA